MRGQPDQSLSIARLRASDKDPLKRPHSSIVRRLQTSVFVPIETQIEPGEIAFHSANAVVAVTRMHVARCVTSPSPNYSFVVEDKVLQTVVATRGGTDAAALCLPRRESDDGHWRTGRGDDAAIVAVAKVCNCARVVAVTVLLSLPGPLTHSLATL
jgi:hypothetical protein